MLGLGRLSTNRSGATMKYATMSTAALVSLAACAFGQYPSMPTQPYAGNQVVQGVTPWGASMAAPRLAMMQQPGSGACQTCGGAGTCGSCQSCCGTFGFRNEPFQ